MQSKLIVIAIGGNSLIEDPKNVTIESQYEAARKTATHIARLIKAGHRVVIAHGNGPQVGYVLLRSEYSRSILHSVPLDSCVADTQGAIGYQLQMALKNELAALGITDANVATVVTQVEVSDDDPSFGKPTKPIGSFMTAAEAEKREAEDGWVCTEDAGRGYRRVVASPKPVSIVEIETVKALLDNKVVVIAAGGGGIPWCVTRTDALRSRGGHRQDLAAALMAKALHADLFVISTAVEKVFLNWGKPNQKALETITADEAQTYIEEGHFAPGSMLPKVEAIVDFVRSTGNMGLITDPANLYGALYEGKGTKVVS